MNFIKIQYFTTGNSISKRIGFLILGGFSLVLIVTFSTFLIIIYTTSTNEMKKDMSALAGLLGINCAAPLLFNDQNAAQDILAALPAIPRVQAAYVLEQDHTIFAEYVNSTAFEKKPFLKNFGFPPGEEGFDFWKNRYFIHSPILFENKTIGSVYIASDLRRVYSHLKWFVTASIIIMVLTGSIVRMLFTRLQRTIEALRESENRYRNVFENTGTAMFILDENYKISMANSMFEKFSQYSKDEIEEQLKWTDLINGKDIEINQRTTPGEYDVQWKDHDEKTKYIFMKTNPLPGTQKRIISLTDITTIKEAEEELRKSEQMKTEFIYVASHELRTPVQSMLLGVSGLLHEEAIKNDPSIYEDVEMVTNGVNRLASLVESLLDLSRIETDSSTLKIKKIPVKHIVDNVTNEISSLAAQYRHKIKIINQLGFFSIPMDQSKIEQVFINLLGNSIKYNPMGGVIIFKVEIRNNEIVFWIADNGLGIPKSAQKDIFEKFFQADSFMSQQVGGAGLGLTISKRIIDSHFGSIKCISPVPEGMFPELVLGGERKGTVFIVSLPFGLQTETPGK